MEMRGSAIAIISDRGDRAAVRNTITDGNTRLLNVREQEVNSVISPQNDMRGGGLPKQARLVLLGVLVNLYYLTFARRVKLRAPPEPVFVSSSICSVGSCPHASVNFDKPLNDAVRTEVISKLSKLTLPVLGA